MNILSDDRLWVINYLGIFLFLLKLFGVYGGIGYFWIICLIAWQPTIAIAAVGTFIVFLWSLFMLSVLSDVYHNILKRLDICKLIGHQMYSKSDDIAEGATCKHCGFSIPAIVWPRSNNTKYNKDDNKSGE